MPLDEIEHNRLARDFAGIETSWNTSTGGTNTTVGDIHACNCIGCCRECGMCSTNPKHTPKVCSRLVRHDAERQSIIYDD